MKTRLLYVLLFISSISFAQNFTDVDMSAFTDNVSDVDLAYDNNGNMYVAYSNANDGVAYVKMFDGTTWTDVGSGASQPFVPTDLDLAIDPSTNNPWLLFRDNTGAFDVVKYDGTSWSTSINDIGGYTTNARKAQLQVDASGNAVVAIQTNRSGERRRLEIFTNKSGSWSMEKLVSNDSFFRSFDLIAADKIVFTSAVSVQATYDIRFNETVNTTGTTWDNTVLTTFVTSGNKFARNLAASGHNNQILYALFDHGGVNHRFRLMDGAAPLDASTDKFDVLDYEYNSISKAFYGIFLKNNNDLIVQRYEESINLWTNENVNITATGTATRAKLRVDANEKVQVIYIEGNKVKLKEQTPVEPQLTIYVDADATGNNDGTSWADAYTNLQDAIDAYSRTDQEIWVAEGTYLPTYNINLSTTDREKTFFINKTVKIYGGFAGSETNLEDRDPSTNIVTLSGDLNQDDSTTNIAPSETSRSDNAYHVVTLKGNIANRVVIDGVTISGGNANGGETINCSVAAASQYDHRTNAAVNLNPVSPSDKVYLELNNCIVENNSATNNIISRTSPCGTQSITIDFNIYNSIIRKNHSVDASTVTVAGANGFGITTRSKMINSLFYENHSDNSASVFYFTTSTSSGGNSNGIAGTEVINCTVANNTSGNLKAVRLVRGNAAKFYNTIIYGNGSINPVNVEAGSDPAVENCMLQGGQFGSNFNNPEFVDASNGDFSVQSTSLAVDGGNNSRMPSNLTTDVAGNDRIKFNAIDIGAYESDHARLPDGLYTFVDLNATGNNDGTSWDDAYTDLQTAINNYSGKTILVAGGTYKPTTSNSNPRKATFLINDVVKLIGSLPSGAQFVGDQDLTNSPTILSGDLNGDDNAVLLDTEPTRQDNAYHVVTVKGNFGTGSTMDGFVITGGNSNGTRDVSCSTPEPNQFDDRVGAGVYSNPDDGGRSVHLSLINCIVEKNTGLLYAAFSRFNPCGSQDTNSHIDFIHSRIKSNYTKDSENINYAGNQQYDINTYGKLINTLIYDNETAASASASAIRMSSSGSASHPGGASFLEIINCTITGNRSPNNKAINMNMHTAGGTVYNTIIYGNGGNNPILFAGAQPPMSNNLFEGGQLGSLSGDPMLNSDFTLQTGSAAIDAGNNSFYPSTYTTDLYGNDRFFNNDIDLGVHEYNPALSTKDEVFDNENILSVYPNPVSTNIFIKSSNEIQEVKIYNLLGKEVLQSTSNQINVSRLQQGMYLVRIKTDKGLISKKIIKK